MSSCLFVQHTVDILVAIYFYSSFVSLFVNSQFLIYPPTFPPVIIKLFATGVCFYFVYRFILYYFYSTYKVVLCGYLSFLWFDSLYPVGGLKSI